MYFAGEIMKRVYFENYKNVRILILNFSNGNSVQEILDTVKQGMKVIQSEPLNSVRVLSQLTGVRFNTDVFHALKQLTIQDKPFVKASAVVGLSNFQSILVDTVENASQRKFAVFKNDPEARDWLLKQK
ncbi:MAG: hypothetical protein ACI86H_001372 [bacterium]|jgi:hypothetical protein